MAEVPSNVDVLIAGAGLAGHAAALAAAESGAAVLLLEKLPRFGGSSAMAGGGLVFAGTQLQRESGVDDSPERLRADLDRAGHGKGDPVLLDSYVEAQQAAYSWLCGLGAEFQLSGGPVPRLHAMPRGALVELLHRRVQEHPSITYVCGAAVERLHRVDGGPAEVEAGLDGRSLTIEVLAGVVLATGGFSRNAEMVARLAPQCVSAVPMGGEGNTGDGIRLGQESGAALADLEWIEASYGAALIPEDAEPRLLYAQADGAVIVNGQGHRFADETSDIKALGRACAEQPGGISFQVFDQAVMRRSRTTPSPRDFAAALADGLLLSAPTLAELAGRLGMPGGALERSAEERGRLLRAQGTDADIEPLTSPPFYAYPCRSGLTTTYGGLRVDGAMRVLDRQGAPIANLFAAGEVIGGFHGAGYLVGSALGKAAVFGMVAGRGAAGRRGEAPAPGAVKARSTDHDAQVVRPNENR